MRPMRAAFKRKNIRLHRENYRGERSYFVTLCFGRRACYGADPRIARWLILSLREAAHEEEFTVAAYCLMPDHLHLLVAGASARSDLLAFVREFKQRTAFAFSRRNGRRLWQFKFYDHILRKADAAERVAWYIWLNPVRKGLCQQPHDYPYSGSFTGEGARLFGSLPRENWIPPWRTTRRTAAKKMLP